MKRTLSHLMWILVLAAPLTAGAQFDDQYNVIDLYPIAARFYETYRDDCAWEVQGQVFTVGVYLWFPVNYDFDGGQLHEVQHVGGFECSLRPENTVLGSAVILARRFPVPAIDVGRYDTMIVGFGEPVPVNWVLPTLLAEVDVFFGPPEAGLAAAAPDKASPYGCYPPAAILWLEPASPPSIVDRMAYIDADDPDIDPLVGADAYEGYSLGTLLITPLVVGNEDLSWDGVKALYR